MMALYDDRPLQMTIFVISHGWSFYTVLTVHYNNTTTIDRHVCCDICRKQTKKEKVAILHILHELHKMNVHVYVVSETPIYQNLKF